MLCVDSLQCSGRLHLKSSKKKKKIKKEERKPSRHWDTQKGGAQHDNQLTLKEANTEV